MHSSRQGITIGTCKTKVNQTDLDLFTNIPAYSIIFKHNQAYSGTIQTHSGIVRTFCNPGIFKILECSELWNIQNPSNVQNTVKYLRWSVL